MWWARYYWSVYWLFLSASYVFVLYLWNVLITYLSFFNWALYPIYQIIAKYISCLRSKTKRKSIIAYLYFIVKVEIFLEQRKVAKIWIFLLWTFRNSNFRKFCWVIRTQPISVLKLFLLYIPISYVSRKPWLKIPYLSPRNWIFLPICNLWYKPINKWWLPMTNLLRF